MKETISGGGVVIGPQGKVLLVEQGGPTWSLPKGHLESGESALDAARREIVEESGIQEVFLKEDLGSYQRYRIGQDQQDDKSEMKTLHMFLFETMQEELKPEDRNILSAKWVRKEEVCDLLTHPKDRAFFLSILPKI